MKKLLTILFLTLLVCPIQAQWLVRSGLYLGDTGATIYTSAGHDTIIIKIGTDSLMIAAGATGSLQLWDTQEIWHKTLYIESPDTLPDADSAFVVSNETGATVTLDSIRLIHNCLGGNEQIAQTFFHRIIGDTTLAPTVIDAITAAPRLHVETTLTSATVPDGSEIGFIEITNDGNTNATYEKIEFFGTYVKSKNPE